MAWIELHQSLPTHRKTMALCDSLGIEPVHAVGHLTCLWLWALDNAPDGDLRAISAKTIARAAMWKKSPDAFLQALIDAGFVEPDSAIHNWDAYAGKLNDRRVANRERMRRARATDTEPPDPGTNGTRAEHVLRTNSARAPATVPNRTGPNQTGENRVTPSGAKAPSPPGEKRRRVTEVDDALVAEILDEYAEVFGSQAAVRDIVDTALSHKARLKCTDQRAYLRGWVRRDALRLGGKSRRMLAVMDTDDEPLTSGCPGCHAMNWDVSWGPLCPGCTSRQAKGVA